MSLSYAESLSPFPHKGKVGMPELSETPEDLKSKEIFSNFYFNKIISLKLNWINWNNSFVKVTIRLSLLELAYQPMLVFRIFEDRMVDKFIITINFVI